LLISVETLAHVALILRGGWDPQRLWSVTGAVARPGCYAAPIGVSTRELVETYAGGFTDEVGAIVPGGAASGILPPAALDVPLTREALAPWGCGVGSAAVQVFPARYPVQRLLAETMRFFAEESCQKCTPCRIGNRALHAVFAGERELTPEQREEWLLAMELTSICGLGQAAPIPVRSALAHWPELAGRMER
jgi:formate dehydrogenase beta subunit